MDDIVDWLTFYNRRRFHSTLGCLNPMRFEENWRVGQSKNSWALVVYRIGRWRYGVRPASLRKLLSGLYKIAFKFVQIITGIELPCEVEIGRNFVIDHFGGIIISGYTKFGDNCRIRNGVCIGLSRVGDPCAAVISNNVDIGSGAKRLGRIIVGDNC